jgi:hypothetical protein
MSFLTARSLHALDYRDVFPGRLSPGKSIREISIQCQSTDHGLSSLEVDQESKGLFRSFKVIQELGLMHGSQLIGGFEFQNDGVLDEDIRFQKTLTQRTVNFKYGAVYLVGEIPKIHVTQ